MSNEDIIALLEAQGCWRRNVRGGVQVMNGDYRVMTVHDDGHAVIHRSAWDGNTVDSVEVDAIDGISANIRANGSVLRMCVEGRWRTYDLAREVDMDAMMALAAERRERPVDMDTMMALGQLVLPDHDRYLWRDELSGCRFIDPAVIGRRDRPMAMEEGWYTDVVAYVQARFREMGFRRMPAKQTVLDFLESIFLHNPRNPFIEMVIAVRWDGIRRVDGWFIETFGARATPIAEEHGEEFEDTYLRELSRRWALGAIARNLPGVEDTVHEIVPVFVGPQGCGKTSGLKYTGLGERTGLAGESAYYTATARTAEDVPRLLEALNGIVVGELAECTQFRTSANEDLKAFISTTTDILRAPYARTASPVKRHFILAGTSNDTTLFTDNTGSRRYFPLDCDPSRVVRRADILLRERDFYEVRQMWAEALDMYLSGERQHLPDGLRVYADVMQDAATAMPIECEIYNNALDKDARSRELGTFLLATEIMDIVRGFDGGTYTESDKRAFKVWKRFCVTGELKNRRWEERRSKRGKDRTTHVYFKRVAEPEDKECGPPEQGAERWR